MELPDDLQAALNNKINKVDGADIKQLLNASQDISLRYRRRDNIEKGGHFIQFIQNDTEALAYAVSRMPATYGAVYNALKYTLENIDIVVGVGMETDPYKITSLLDIGAGTGAASWAANELIDLNSITCIEYDEHMRNLGKTLMSEASAPLKTAKWENINIASDSMPFKAEADLIIASYIINELEESESVRLKLKTAEKLWSAAKKILLFVETGTPEGYRLLNKIRTNLVEQNAHIIAPCFHEDVCPVSEKESDWCHFACRIQRNRLHKLAKGGDAPFEDEKYTYLALAKENITQGLSANYARILRHPQINKGHVKLDLCAKDGLKQAIYSKRGGGIYKYAKKSKCGDKINLKREAEYNP